MKTKISGFAAATELSPSPKELHKQEQKQERTGALKGKIRVDKKTVCYRGGIWLFRIFRMVLLIGISFLVLYPILQMLSMAFRPASELHDASVIWIPKRPTLENFRTAFQELQYFKTGFYILRISLVSTAIQLVICSITAYGLARFRFPGRNVLFVLVVLTIIVPIQTVQIPMYVYYSYFDFFGIGKIVGLFTGTPLTVSIINTEWVYYLPAMFGMGLRSGIYIFVLRQFFMGLPKELENAAKIDGCNAFQTFVRIMAPITIPAFVTVFLLSMVAYWNDSVISSTFNAMSDTRTLFQQLSAYMNYASTGASESEWQAAQVWLNAAAVWVVLPMTLMYIFGQRFFMECMDRSGIKE